MNVIKSYTDLVSKLAGKSIVVVEGARCTGKDHLIGRLSRSIAGSSYFEIMSPRKKYMDANGSVKLPDGVSIQQGHLWVIECLRQLRGPFIVNRGMLSGQYFDTPNRTLFEMWINMMKEHNGVVVLLHPEIGDHSARIRAARRSAEASSISAEKVGLQRLAQELPENMLLVFSESQLDK